MSSFVGCSAFAAQQKPKAIVNSIKRARCRDSKHWNICCPPRDIERELRMRAPGAFCIVGREVSKPGLQKRYKTRGQAYVKLCSEGLPRWTRPRIDERYKAVGSFLRVSKQPRWLRPILCAGWIERLPFAEARPSNHFRRPSEKREAGGDSG